MNKDDLKKGNLFEIVILLMGEFNEDNKEFNKNLGKLLFEYRTTHGLTERTIKEVCDQSIVERFMKWLDFKYPGLIEEGDNG